MHSEVTMSGAAEVVNQLGSGQLLTLSCGTEIGKQKIICINEELERYKWSEQLVTYSSYVNILQVVFRLSNIERASLCVL